MELGFEISDIFEVSNSSEFEALALKIFRFQAANCLVYSQYLEVLGCDPKGVLSLDEVPMLPIELFKSRRIYCADQPEEIVFSSSSTTGMTPAKHYVADTKIYTESFRRGFERYYGSPEKMGIYALLPNYLERSGSSLVFMFKNLIDSAAAGGFYLYDTTKMLEDMAAFDGPKLLIGVSYALLDLAEAGIELPAQTMVMETGGMKGKRKELSKKELHEALCKGFNISEIHSEYGMAELLSQAYSVGGGLFEAVPWLDVRIRDLNDPFSPLGSGRVGGVDIIDLANVFSCSFIQTQDLGVRYDNGRFSLEGRISGSDIRGCNLLVQQ